MIELRKSRKKIIFLILIFIIILSILMKILQNRNLIFQEDLIFFKLFDVGNFQKNLEEGKEKIYKIEINKGKVNYQKINLSQTVDKKTLVNERIAPGTRGSFFVDLISNVNTNYEIKIVNKNLKPKNFDFDIEEKAGELQENKIKRIIINWEWPYEISESQNMQDTLDGQNIEEYNFEICTIGK